ncbi:PspC domain-containing protein [Blastococcus mobilis]|uniref:Phage shock protein C (PspC) family protein n=1 Tax=Blastococcus mobilis TaxID=1938746 RepID=A0A238XGU6_9ACTN|nr:PspC domain-containing protein [Blastococcus mobilis]SNR57801.1 phage shock protein C (PspC) family protein [Blastococcus mobilis]
MTSAPPPAAPPPQPPSPQPPSWPPPPPGPPSARPQLRRNRTDKILGGVNGGLAEYSGIDALLWRVGFVALTLAGGAGVIVYLLLWVLMPAGPRPHPGSAVELQEKAPVGPRSPVPGVTIAGLLIVVGLLALVTNVSDWDIPARGFFGSALLVVGLGLVAAAFTRGRTARGGLIALGVVLSAALITSTADWHGAREGMGDRTYRPATAAEVRDVYRGGVGDMTIDLTRLDRGFSGGPVTTRIEHGVGDLEIVVPRSADVRLDVEHGPGDVQVFDRGSDTEGFFPGEGSRSWTDDGEPEFVLSINSGFGDVEVSRD